MIWDAFLCGIEHWTDIWGDPLLSGTIFMASYGVTALLIFRASSGAEARENWYWKICGSLFLFQMFNTNLDLHALIFTTGRCLAHAQGWYENRREFQFILLLVLAFIISLILLVVLIVFFRNIIENILLTLGVSIALGFTLIKGINYHDIEQYYSHAIGPFRVADFIEFSGVVLANIAALIRLNTNKIRRGYR